MDVDAVLAAARRATRRRGDPVLHGRGLARGQATTRQFDRVLEMIRGRQGARPGGLLHARHGHRGPGPADEGGRARRLQPQPRLVRGVLRPDHLDPDLSATGSTRSATSARPGSRSAAAGSSAWARPRTTGSACCTRWPPCPSRPRASRSTPWWPSRGRRWPTGRRVDDLGHGPHDRHGPDPDAPVDGPALGRPARMTEAEQALCFLAGANSIFAGDKLLTTPNPGSTADQPCSSGSG